MKKMSAEAMAFFILVCIAIGVVVLSAVIVNAIGKSDLPLWMKYWLLK